jgi:hypothetical protein
MTVDRTSNASAITSKTTSGNKSTVKKKSLGTKKSLSKKLDSKSKPSKIDAGSKSLHCPAQYTKNAGNSGMKRKTTDKVEGSPRSKRPSNDRKLSSAAAAATAATVLAAAPTSTKKAASDKGKPSLLPVVNDNELEGSSDENADNTVENESASAVTSKCTTTTIMAEQVTTFSSSLSSTADNAELVKMIEALKQQVEKAKKDALRMESALRNELVDRWSKRVEETEEFYQ